MIGDTVYSLKISDFAIVLEQKTINGTQWLKLGRDYNRSITHIARATQTKLTRRIHIGNLGDKD